MIRLASLADQQKVASAVEGAGQPAARLGRIRARARNAFTEDGYDVRIGVLADGEDLGPKLDNAQWGQSGTPITLDATFAGRLPRRLHHAKVHLVVEVEDVLVHQMVGHKTAPVPVEDPGTTDILSSSASSLSVGDDAVKLGQFTEYPNVEPDAMVWDYVKALPYNKNHVSIQRIPGVTLDYSAHGEYPGFGAEEPVSSLLSALSEDHTVGYRYRDTAYNGFEAWVPKAISALGPDEGPTGKVYSASNLPDWFRQRPTPPLIRYSAVRVFHNGPDGRPLYEWTEEVPYRADEKRPLRRQTLDIPFDDASEEGPDNARRLARRRALELARSSALGELLLPAFDPLVETDDPFRVEEAYRDDDGFWELAWAMRINEYTHYFGGSGDGLDTATGSLSTQVKYAASLVAEERINAPTFIGPRRTAKTGVVMLPRPPYGRVADDLYFEDSLAWVAAQGDDLIFYDNSAGAASVSGDDLVVSE